MENETKVSPEPRLIADGYSDAEIFDWMQRKLHASNQLKIALSDRESLRHALHDVQVRIDNLTKSAALEFEDTNSNPTPRQETQ